MKPFFKNFHSLFFSTFLILHPFKCFLSSHSNIRKDYELGSLSQGNIKKSLLSLELSVNKGLNQLHHKISLNMKPLNPKILGRLIKTTIYPINPKESLGTLAFDKNFGP